jgi:hypothetical protein
MTSDQSSAMLRLAVFAGALAVVFALAFTAGRALEPVGGTAPATPVENSEVSHDDQHSH